MRLLWDDGMGNALRHSCRTSAANIRDFPGGRKAADHGIGGSCAKPLWTPIVYGCLGRWGINEREGERTDESLAYFGELVL